MSGAADHSVDANKMVAGVDAAAWRNLVNAARTIELLLGKGISAAMVLDENSPTRDALRDGIRAFEVHEAASPAAPAPLEIDPDDGCADCGRSMSTPPELERTAVCNECAQARVAQAVPATPTAEAEDAARYQWLRARVAGVRDRRGIEEFDLPYVRPTMASIMRGSVAQHFDAAIDAAMSAPAQRPAPKGAA